MVSLNTLYDAANTDGATDTTPLTEATSTELLSNIAEEIGVDAQILQTTFGSKLTGLSKDQAVAMLYQLLNAIDSDDSTEEIELGKGAGEITAETFKKALVTELGVEEGDLDNALTDLNSVFKNSIVKFAGEDTDDIEDDTVTVTEDTTKPALTKFALADEAKRTELFNKFGEHEYGYVAPEDGTTGGQVVKKPAGAGDDEEEDDEGNGNPTPTED